MINLFIDTIFPTIVGRIQGPPVDKSLVNYCMAIYKKVPATDTGWLNNTVYTTAGAYNILEDKKFNDINKWIEEQVNTFAKELRYSDYYNLKCGNFILYTKGSSQEFHYHPGYTFSAVYYLTAPEGSSPLYLQAPSAPDMMNPNISEWTNINSMTWNYPALEGQLIMFRSYIEHYVPPHNSDKYRMALVYEL